MLKQKYSEMNSYTNNYNKRKSYINASSPKVKIKNSINNNHKDNLKELLAITAISSKANNCNTSNNNYYK